MVIDTSALLAILQDEPERRAFARYGKGRHPAGLNFGDCFAYALATDRGEPLLFKGAYMAAPAAGAVTDVFIQPFPSTGAKYQVSNGGGRAPVWSPDGKQLFFHNLGPNRIFVVDVNAGRGLTFGTPVPLPIDGTIHPTAQRNYDVTPDGKRLIVVLPVQVAQSDPTRSASAQINVVLNWFEELKARAPHK